jgi:uncharacterized protein YecE (DUF72 family)
MVIMNTEEWSAREEKCNTTRAQVQTFAKLSPLFSEPRFEGIQQNNPSVAPFELFSRYLRWDRIIVDRSNELQEWVKYCHQIVQRGVTVYAFANNHYAGHSPATVRLFRDLWQS